MPEINLNFSKVIDTSKPVDKGTYPALIKGFELKLGKDFKVSKFDFPDDPAAGWPYFSCRGEITEGTFAGRSLWANLTTNPEETRNGNGANFMLFNLLQALGLATERTEMRFDPDAVLNQQVAWVVSLNDDGTNKVDKFLPIS